MHVINIGREDGGALDLRAELIAGLRSTERYVPSLLLWNGRGHELFEKILKDPLYYPLRAESTLLDSQCDDIAAKLDPNSQIVIELGAGNCNKTLSILTALAKRGRRVHYFALDVALDSLQDCLVRLDELTQEWPNVSIGGLLGTYDDCVAFLKQSSQAFAHQGVTFVWQGNSIANLRRNDAVNLLARLVNNSICAAEMLVAVDGCEEASDIEVAYDLPEGHSRSFIQNGLLHANEIMGSPVFNLEDWGFQGAWDEEAHVHNSYHVAKHDIVLDLGQQRIFVKSGQKIHAVVSAKWTTNDIRDIGIRAGLSLVHHWTEQSFGFSMCIHYSSGYRAVYAGGGD